MRAAFVVDVPEGIDSKEALLGSFATAAKFPEYFGGNWDALLDCLRDFEWASDNYIIIKHADLPLRSNPAECRTYLEILREAVIDWSQEPVRPGLPSHKLRVLFPKAVQGAVTALLNA